MTGNVRNKRQPKKMTGNEMNWKEMKRNRRKCMKQNGHERKSKEMKEDWTKQKDMNRKRKENRRHAPGPLNVGTK